MAGVTGNFGQVGSLPQRSGEIIPIPKPFDINAQTPDYATNLFAAAAAPGEAIAKNRNYAFALRKDEADRTLQAQQLEEARGYHAASLGEEASYHKGALEQQRLAQKVELAKAGLTLSDDGQIVPDPSLAGLASDPVKITAITTLRKEYLDRPGTSRYFQANPILKSMAAGVSNPDAASDLDYVYGIGKIYDPESAIRDAEQRMAYATQSLPEQVRGNIQMVLAGKAQLSRESRIAIVNAANTRVSAYRKQAEYEADNYRKLATAQRIDPALVVPDLDAPLDMSTLGGARPPPPVVATPSPGSVPVPP